MRGWHEATTIRKGKVITMTNVGILTCSNSVNEMACSSLSCFNAAYDRTGALGEHNDEIRIKGMVNCAGCPTKIGFGKILRRVNSLIASGIEVLHFGNCMVGFCPFISKYEQAIQEANPGLKIVRGVHPVPPDDAMANLGERFVAELTSQRPTTPELVKEVFGG